MGKTEVIKVNYQITTGDLRSGDLKKKSFDALEGFERLDTHYAGNIFRLFDLDFKGHRPDTASLEAQIQQYGIAINGKDKQYGDVEIDSKTGRIREVRRLRVVHNSKAEKGKQEINVNEVFRIEGGRLRRTFYISHENRSMSEEYNPDGTIALRIKCWTQNNEKRPDYGSVGISSPEGKLLYRVGTTLDLGEAQPTNPKVDKRRYDVTREVFYNPDTGDWVTSWHSDEYSGSPRYSTGSADAEVPHGTKIEGKVFDTQSQEYMDMADKKKRGYQFLIRNKKSLLHLSPLYLRNASTVREQLEAKISQ